MKKLQGIAKGACSTYSLITLGKYINVRGRQVIYNNIASYKCKAFQKRFHLVSLFIILNEYHMNCFGVKLLCGIMPSNGCYPKSKATQGSILGSYPTFKNGMNVTPISI